MIGDELAPFLGGAGIADLHLAIELAQNVMQRLEDERMVIHDQDLHGAPLSVLLVFAPDGSTRASQLHIARETRPRPGACSRVWRACPRGRRGAAAQAAWRSLKWMSVRSFAGMTGFSSRWKPFDF